MTYFVLFYIQNTLSEIGTNVIEFSDSEKKKKQWGEGGGIRKNGKRRKCPSKALFSFSIMF